MDGTPYAGVKIFHYAAGTTTEKNIWSDEGKTTLLSQPHTGDSNGMIWFYADGDYRLQVTDANNITLYDWDNVRITADTATMWEGNLGTSYPAASPSNKGQLFAKVDGSDLIQELGINDNGAGFKPIPLAQDIIWVGQYTSFAAAVTAIGASEKTLIVNSNQTISTAVTVPSTLSINIMGSGKFTKIGSGTLTFNGPFEAPLKKVFSGFEAGNITGLKIKFIEWYGAKLDGTTDDAAAINLAVYGGGNVRISEGNILVNSEIIVDEFTTIECAGIRKTVFRAGTNNQNIFHWIGGYGSLRHCGMNNALLKTGVTGLRITPLNESGTTTVKDIYYNYFEDLWITYFAEAIVLQSGPFVAGTGSCTCYNTFNRLVLDGNTRGIWFKEGPNASAAGSNRNVFMSVRIGTSNTNTGIWIDGGSTTNRFIGIAFEGIANGTSPSTIPTAVKIPVVSGPTSGTATSDNQFIGVEFEGNTRDVDMVDGTDTSFVSGRIPGTVIGNFALRIGPDAFKIGSPIEMQEAANPGRFSSISTTGGSSSNFNGLALSANQRIDGTQGNATLPSWRLDVGGLDGSTYPGTADTVTFFRRPAGGAYSKISQISVNGIVAKVFATASLPIGDTSMDGTILIEDAGVGDRNFIIYAGGQRFRIDGGGAV